MSAAGTSHRHQEPNGSTPSRPLTIGVFGGSFNPIHLGHALLAITTQQTKPVDKLVLVPVFKHAVKTDLLPFDDRVAMCELAVAPFRGEKGIEVSTVERDVGESNGAMLRALKERYPKGSKFLWICGDDFFRWMERPKGLETLNEVSGLIVQRRLHKATGEESKDRFYKEPIDEAKIRATADRLNLEIDFIYGELPHFSSTLVRRAPGAWRSFLPQSVAKYLDGRPDLLAQLHANLEADAKEEEESAERAAKRQRSFSTENNVSSRGLATACVMRGLEAVHTLQRERGRTGLWLSVAGLGGTAENELQEARANTDSLIREILEAQVDFNSLEGYDEVLTLATELKQIPVWLKRDREITNKRRGILVAVGGPEGWAGRFALAAKFNPRIDVLIGATIRALTEILEMSDRQADGGGAAVKSRELPDLLLKWCEGHEALGRLRAFVCSGGPAAPSVVRSSVEMRERLNQTIETKERSIARVLSLQEGMLSRQTRLGAPDALHRLLEKVTTWEWSLMGCFASSTPLPLVHKLLASKEYTAVAGLDSDIAAFDVEMFFDATSSAIDLMLSFAKALAASGCAGA